MKHPIALLACGLCLFASKSDSLWAQIGQELPNVDALQSQAPQTPPGLREPGEAQLTFFEKRIRPVLVEHCYQCHSASSNVLGGGLQLDAREPMLKGGDTGPAVVPNQPADSLLLTAIRHTDRNLIMPPKESGPKLPDQVIADFELWIRLGAVDPRSETQTGKRKHDPEAAKNWWAWQPPQTVSPPVVAEMQWVRDPIDQFILASLQRSGLSPAADASRTQLVRRLAFDLTELPPTVPELYDYALSPQPRPIEELVDRYLDSPAYGERMARRWLDVARFAESAGKDVNGTYPHAWRYRDYVIDAFNADLPYNDFVVEQVAGDLLPSESTQDKARQRIATGFLALGAKSLNEMNVRQFAADVADEQIETVSQAFLGVTIACARCHDHKFDPITQRDYTAMAGIFLSTRTHFGSQGGVGGRNRNELLELPQEYAAPRAYTTITTEDYARKSARAVQLRDEQREMLAERARERARGGAQGNPGPEFLRVQRQLVALETELAMYNPDGSVKALVMGVSDKPTGTPAMPLLQRTRQAFADRMQAQRPGVMPPELQTIGDARLLERGEVDKPGERVPRGLPVFLSPGRNQRISPSTSGRLELARWMASDINPLTSRVMVNRIWSWLMGRGLVASLDNFGSTGDKPSHPELLDYLANQFVSTNWSVKQLVRRIVLSHVYAMSSEHNAASFAIDPDNQLYWRANPRTLEAEAVRDALLCASGMIDLSRPHGSHISRAGDTVIGAPAAAAGRALGLSEDQITKADSNHRSIYLPIPRNLLPDALELFDFPDNAMVHGARETTLVPSQSLFWMNSPTVQRTARAIAERVFPGVSLSADQDQSYQSDAGTVAARYTNVCLLILNRLPYPDETKAVEEFVAAQTTAGTARDRIWTSICRATLSSADFRRLR